MVKKKLWQNVLDFIIENIDENDHLQWKKCVFGDLMQVRRTGKLTYLINVILLMAKFHIHKWMYMYMCKYDKAVEREEGTSNYIMCYILHHFINNFLHRCQMDTR